MTISIDLDAFFRWVGYIVCGFICLTPLWMFIYLCVFAYGMGGIGGLTLKEWLKEKWNKLARLLRLRKGEGQ